MPTIAELNDQLRRSVFSPKKNRVVFAGELVHEPDLHLKAIMAVMAFNDFNPDNDPYGEHDLGVFKIGGVDFMFKIDAYDNDLRYASPDPADPAVTVRVLTIFKSKDY